MEFIKTDIDGLVIIEPRVHKDDRGYFFESYNQKEFEAHVGKINFVQDNESKSTFGVLRGLHYQLPPYAQAKLVRVIEGKVLDVAVDLRKDSPTFGQHISVELSAENKRQFFVPRGFAHGFVVLSETAIFSYKVDNFYDKDSERAIRYDDADLNIDWKIAVEDIRLSEKDSKAPNFKEAVNNH